MALSKNDVRILARQNDLLTPTKTNPHLVFQDGDIAWWFDRDLSAAQLNIQFQARRAVLQEADRKNEYIPEQGDLSFKAEQLIKEQTNFK